MISCPGNLQQLPHSAYTNHNPAALLRQDISNKFISWCVWSVHISSCVPDLHTRVYYQNVARIYDVLWESPREMKYDDSTGRGRRVKAA